MVTHQPVHVPRAEERHNLLRNHRAAIRSWSAAGADLILGGHIHLPYVLPLTPAASLRTLPAAQSDPQASNAEAENLADSPGLIPLPAESGYAFARVSANYYTGRP